MEKKLYIFLTILFGFILINSLLYTAIKTKKLEWYSSEIDEYFGNSTENFENFTVETTALPSEEDVKIETLFLNVDSTRNAQNVCALPVYDFWLQSIKPLMNGFTPTKNCDKNYTKWTELEDSTWRIVKEGANCKARCFEGIGGGKPVIFQNWTTPGHVDCEFLEAVCWENDAEVYGHIHTQIVPKTADPPKNHSSVPPNVFVFTIDSMNTGMAKRSLPKFLSYFQLELGAVEFPFVNKIGENSQPNGIPLWFGKTFESGRKVTWEEIEADWDPQRCNVYLDQFTHIFKEFKQYNYTTFLLEDWANTMIDSWPFCKGFKESPVDHLFRPYTAVRENYGMEITKKHLNGQFCREAYHGALEHLEKGIQTYKDRPLFSWMWLTDIAHDHIDGVMRIEDPFFEFFKRNQEILDNSFVFFVSDHGFRIGYSSHLSTEIGNFERDNPYLAISIPRKYRDEKFGILEIMRKNSKQLQTHFDTRATLLDILKYQPESEFMDRATLKIAYEKGDSLIRHQSDIPRTCSTLPIPKQYCICQVEKFQIRNSTLKTHLGQKVLDHVHQLLAESNFTEICEKFQVKEVTNLIEYGYTKQWNTYKISIKTQLPSTAHFETMMTYDNVTDTANFEKVVRLDTYGITADCTKNIRHEPLCYCKNQ